MGGDTRLSGGHVRSLVWEGKYVVHVDIIPREILVPACVVTATTRVGSGHVKTVVTVGVVNYVVVSMAWAAVLSVVLHVYYPVLATYSYLPSTKMIC